MISEKYKSLSHIATLVLVCVLSFMFIYIGNKVCRYSSADSSAEEIQTATVQDSKITVETLELTEDSKTTIVTFMAKITSGPQKGKIVKAEQEINPMIQPVPEQVKAGDKIIMTTNSDLQSESDVGWYYVSQNRIPSVIWLVIIFFVMILIIGKLKGITTIISLIITVGAIFGVYVPAILSGRNIYITTVVVILFIILSSLFALNGFNKKSVCAVVGNFGGIIISGILALAVNSALDITGLIDQDYILLTSMNSNFSIDLRGVIWGGVLIGSLGAIMDVAMSIASAMSELSEQMHEKSFKKMVTSGMNIGKDAIGTMTNTLILAYVGGSLATVLLFTAYNKSLLILFNFEMIVVEIIQAVVGSMGILLAVPVTVVFSAWIFDRKANNKQISDGEVKSQE